METTKAEEQKESKVHTYESLIMGTGLFESIVSAGLATHKSLSMNIECENGYSGSMRTFSMRELKEFLEGGKKKSQYQDENIFDFKYKLEDDLDFDGFIKKHGFRGWNIDLTPRVILSSSNATDMMIQARIDNYISFRVFKGIYTVGKDKLEGVPTHKGEIFKSSELTLMEKKQLFTFLSVSMRYFNKEFKAQEEHNSINDFKKNVYSEHQDVVEELQQSENLKDQHFIQFLKKSGLKSKKLIKLIAYCLCNYKMNPFSYKKNSFENQSASEMLKRLSRFIESLNIQSTLPYLFPIYGTGDITQIFSRISSVYGGLFMLDHSFEVLEYNFTKEEKHNIKFKLRGEEFEASVNNIYLGGNYKQFAKDVLKVDSSKFETHQEKITINRIAVAFKMFKKGDEKEAPFELPVEERLFPLIIQVPDNFSGLGNTHPISCIITDYTCGSCPFGYCVVYIDYILNDDKDSQSEEEKVVLEVMKRVRKTFDEYDFAQKLLVSHKQIYRNSELIDFGNKILVLPDGDIGLDMETAFMFGHKFVTKTDDLKVPLFDRETTDQKKKKEKEEQDIDEESKQLLEELEEFDF